MHCHWFKFSVLSVFSAVLLAKPATPAPTIWGDPRVKHTWNSVPTNWESLGPPPAGTTIDLHIALKPHNENGLIDALYEVSDPRHQKYGVHLSKEQIAELVAPHQDTLEIAHSWLEYHGVPSSSISTSHGGGWLTITGVPASQADELLCASYRLYRHTGTNETEIVLRTVGYALPEALHAHVRTIVPTTHFGSPRTQLLRKRPSEEAAVVANATSGELVRAPSRRDVVGPSILRWLYKTESYVPAAMGQNAIGILGFDTGSPSHADLTRFMTDYRPDGAAATYSYAEVNGAVYDPNNPGLTASISIQYTSAMAYPTPQIFFYTGGTFYWRSGYGYPLPGDAFLSWFSFLFNLPKIPPTISVSYTDPEPWFPPEYTKAICSLFAELGLRGVSVLVPSGDHGVGSGNCNDGSGNAKFVPMFPASCPWVTSVGGTMGFAPEVAARFSGGGFSLYFQRPFYQDYAVPTYLSRIGTRHAGLYHREGRGIPDISALADQCMFIHDTVLTVTSSTHCSTPMTANVQTIAGIVSLLNDFLISTGRAPLGFLNSFLYLPGLIGMGINDVILGSNTGCNLDGFLATIGWDPATGVGTPHFQRLLNILSKLRPREIPTGTP